MKLIAHERTHAPMGLTKMNIPKIKVKDSEPPYASRATNSALFPHHQLIGVVGSRGCGKTQRIIEYFMMMNKSHSFDKIYWFSPTFLKEEKSKNLTEDKSLKIEVFKSYSDEKLQEIIQEVEAMIVEYKEYQEYEKIYAKFLKLHRAHQHDSASDEEFAHYFKHEELELLEKYNYAPITPNPFPHGYPCVGLVYDDMVSEKRIFSPTIKGKATNLFLNHRHISMTIIMSTQVFKNGIPNAIRGGNISMYWLFPTKSEQLQKIIANEVAHKVKPEVVIEAWDFATKDDAHSFLLIDYDTKDKSRMFRKNFDNIINIAGLNARSDSD